MPTRRFSTMSTRPQPKLPTRSFNRWMTPSGVIASPSTDTGTPASNPTTTSTGSVAVGVVRSHTPCGGRFQGSSISPHSIARPQMLSSMEYTFSFVATIGMSWS
jgi:hypothetical protein